MTHKISAKEPKAVWDFFKNKVESKESVVCFRDREGVRVTTAENLEPPDDQISEDRVRSADWLVFLKVLTALFSGRPVKFVPDKKDFWKVYIGPKMTSGKSTGGSVK